MWMQKSAGMKQEYEAERSFFNRRARSSCEQDEAFVLESWELNQQEFIMVKSHSQGELVHHPNIVHRVILIARAQELMNNLLEVQQANCDPCNTSPFASSISWGSVSI